MGRELGGEEGHGLDDPLKRPAGDIFAALRLEVTLQQLNFRGLGHISVVEAQRLFPPSFIPGISPPVAGDNVHAPISVQVAGAFKPHPGRAIQSSMTARFSQLRKFFDAGALGLTQDGLVQIRDVLQHVDGVSFCYFDRNDVVRHRLVKEIIDAYDKFHANGKTPGGA